MIKKSGLLRLVAITLLAGLVLAACGTPAPPPEEEGAIKVALVMPGSIADQGYNAAAYAGLMAIEKDLGAEVAYSEMVPLAEYEETFRDFAAEGYDVVIGHGFEFGDPIEIIAPEFPEPSFLA